MRNQSPEAAHIDLPDDSIFELDEYLEMWRTAATEPGFRVLCLLQEEGPLSASELSERLERDGNELHYYLRQLRRSALIQVRKGPTTGTEETYTRYLLTDIGQTVLSDGVRRGIEQLVAEEREFATRQ